jgi:DNA modification methylase
VTVQLILGDCLEIMPTLADGSVDAIITDPPYGVDYVYSSYQDTKQGLQKLKENLIYQARRISKRTAIFTGVMNVGFYSDADWFYSWVCPAGTGVSAFGFTCHTPIAFYGKDAYSGKGSRPDVFVDYKPKRTGVDHPCEKPLSVMRWAVERFSLKGDTILDPFMGSGTTGVACVQLGRNFIGVEIDPHYFEIAKKRIEQAQLQEPLFV